jgi:ABC-type antimicrobial peptide transport system permease subunit
VRRGVDESIFLERMTATLSACFGALALLLAAVGLYGVMAYAVACRTGEIGIRMALGAARGQVLRMVLGDGLRLVGWGLLIGLPLAFAAGRAGSSLLYGVQPGDPLSLSLTVVVLLAAAGLAAWIPARRAASIAPLDALRNE